MTGRHQFVLYKGKNSTLRPINCGVPQGSVLGPLLFLLYINDLSNCSEFKTILFADDTTLQLSDENAANLIIKANVQLTNISDWFKANLLTLNIRKTKFIIFAPPSKRIEVNALKSQLVIDNIPIEQVGSECTEKSFKFVGFHIDETLSWQYHIKSLVKALSFANYTIAKNKNALPLSIRRTLYLTLFQSHLQYAIMFLGALPKGKIKIIKNIQKKCIRNVAGPNETAGVNDLFKKLNLLSFDELFDFTCSKFMFKCRNNLLPTSISSLFKSFSKDNRSGSFVTKSSKSKLQDQFPGHYLPKIWNSKHLSVKTATSYNLFKKAYFNAKNSFKRLQAH